MSESIRPIRSHKEFASGQSLKQRLRGMARDSAILTLSLGRSLGRGNGWIRFPYYHHVFEDERKGFARHLDYMGRHGEFIGLDDAVGLLESGAAIDGRYFCVTFDDGFKNCFTNALPILVDKGVSACFFLTTGFIGMRPETNLDRLLGFYEDGGILMEFLDWDECRTMAGAGMTFGSHTVNHVHLSDLDEAGVEEELATSRKTIEKELGQPCRHFCCPFGRPGMDFLPDRDSEIAHRLGYRSFLSGVRGGMRAGDSPMMVRRDHLLGVWGNYQLRYFLCKG